MSEEKLAQPYDAMFERNIGHIAKRGREVEVWVEGLPDSRVGFVAGLDEEFLQLCLSKSGSLSNVRRDLIVSLDETGVTIGGMISASRGTTNENNVDRIKEKINYFQKKATHLINGGAL